MMILNRWFLVVATAVGLGACTNSCGPAADKRCSLEGAKASDPLICPSTSPLLLLADEVNSPQDFALTVFNESDSAALTITDVRFDGPHPEFFSNIQRSTSEVKKGESAIIQFRWEVPTLASTACTGGNGPSDTCEQRAWCFNNLCDRPANLHIISNAKNYPDLNIVVAVRTRTSGGGSSSGGGGSSRAAVSQVPASSVGSATSTPAPASSAAAPGSSG